MRIVYRVSLPLLIIILCLPIPAHANVGLPMVVPVGILMILALVPIIGVEAWVLSVRLSVGFGAALAASGAANLVSTVIGLPVSWLVAGTIGSKARNLLPRSNASWKYVINRITESLFGMIGDTNSEWIIPSAELMYLVPLFFLSWAIESYVVSNMLEGTHAVGISSAVCVANIASYGLLSIVPAVELIQSRKKLGAAIESAANPQIIYEGVTPDGRLISADEYGTVRFANAQTGEQLEVLSPPRAELRCEGVSPDGRFSVARDEHGHGIWENAAKRQVCSLEDDDYFDAVAFSPDSRYLSAVVESVPAIRLWSSETGRLLLSADVAYDYSIAFSPDGRMVTSKGKVIFVRKSDDWEVSEFANSNNEQSEDTCIDD